jgi:LuxR family maltose regulon positive regulatory protein
LSSLEEANLPIVPLDHTRHWYRYHQLLQDLLISELEASEPEAVSRLHRRASRWFIRNDMPELAIHHAQAIGDHETVADNIEKIGRVNFSSGRASAVLGWLAWLEGTGQLDRYPRVAALGAMAFSLVGDAMKADRFAGYIIGDHEAPEPEVHVSAVALLVRSLQARHGLTRSRRDAALAKEKLPPGSDWLPPVLLASALPSIWEGEFDVAEPLLAQAITSGESLTASLVSPFALAERAVIAAARDEWDEAEEYTNRSLQLIRDQGIEEYVTSGLTFVMSARCSRRNGDLARAKTFLARAARLRPVLNSTLPGISAQTLLEQARAYLDLGDVAAARTAMREAEDVIRQRPALGLLPDQLDEMKAGLDSMGSARVGAFTLTKAELRLLPLLSSHLTFPEIGERLYVSRHTVKTQAMSIYRKLGASSRSEAVDKARAAGFLSD